MPYFILALQSLSWFLMNLITLHFQVLSIYFYGLTTVLFGNRVTGLVIEQYSQTLYKKEKLEEVLLDEEETEEVETLEDGDDGTVQE